MLVVEDNDLNRKLFAICCAREICGAPGRARKAGFGKARAGNYVPKPASVVKFIEEVKTSIRSRAAHCRRKTI